MNISCIRFLKALAVCVSACLVALVKVSAQAPTIIYSDLLLNGFQDWSWGTRDFANPSPVHNGSESISASLGDWEAISFYHSDLNASAYTSLSFWANGGTNGGQRLQLYAEYGANSAPAVQLPALPANTWTQIVVTLGALGVATVTNLNRLDLQLTSSGTTGEFYLDDVQLGANAAPALVHLTANRAQALRTADSRWAAVNTAIWDGNFDTATTISLMKEMGVKLLRAPGGSLSDDYHWASNTTDANTWTWQTSFASFVQVATNVGAQAIITVNYGSGTPNEAAAWVAYANGRTTNTTSLGVDPPGVNWQTVAYWASLRAAAPLAQDDGKNFLRLSRSAPFCLTYWEIGNECYGTWETDTNANAHDAYTYALRAKSYLQQMRAVDPTIKIGVVVTTGEDSSANGYTNHSAVNARTGQTHYGWTPVLLTTLKSLGVIPDFVIHHVYPEWSNPNNPAGADSDQSLLQSSTSWAADAADLRQQISDYAGAAGAGIELLCTENNADAGAQGKQSTSLVDGLYYADSRGQLMKTEFNSFVWWDFRNGTDTSGWFDSSLYGWRTYGDLGMVNGLNTRHPAFYAAKLMQYFAQAGDTILATSSDYPWLSMYAAQKTSGALSLLVLNKDPTTTFNTQVALTGYSPAASATIRSFGIPQDEAARTNGPAAAQDIATNVFTGAATTFNYNFPALSLTLFTLGPSAPTLAVVPPAQAGLVLRLQGQPGARYYLQAATDLINWASVSTNSLTASWVNITNPIPAGTAMKLYRAVWQP
jgi:alpha-N-arabinofuranosidase